MLGLSEVILGLYWHNDKETGNHYIIIGIDSFLGNFTLKTKFREFKV